MTAGPVHHALAQVRELQQRILEKQRFKGYSGRARALSGTLALILSAVMSSAYWPRTEEAHVTGWGIVFVVSMVLNFGAIVYWFFFDPATKRDPRRLRPLLDVLPPLFVGSIFTAVWIRNSFHVYLFGTWMCLFGLANLATRQVLPKAIAWVGLYYLICGAFLLISPVSFLNPWPMGIVFFIGEWAGGFVLHFDGNVKSSVSTFLSFSEDHRASIR